MTKLASGFIRATFVGLVIAASAPLALAQDASVYKWVDADGVPHYSDQPPNGENAEELTIRYRKSDKAGLQAKAKAKSELDEATAVRENQEQADADKAEEERKQLLSDREAGCEQARNRMAKYDQARRIFRPGPDGERIYLTDEEIDAERANARRAVGEWCDEA